MNQTAMAVAGVCSCHHENSNLDSSKEVCWVLGWLQEQTPATARLKVTYGLTLGA